MIGYNEAIEMVINKITRSGTSLENPPLIKEHLTKELPWGWLFYYDSKEYIEKGVREKAYIGNAPILVDKIDGSTSYLATLFETEEELFKIYAEEKGYKYP